MRPSDLGLNRPNALLRWDPEKLVGSAEGTILLGHPLLVFEEVPSTNDVALELAENGAPEGTMVIARTQLRGRGRFGREWVSAPGAGFWFSLLLRPRLTHPESALLPTAIGAGVVLALRDIGLKAFLKWPNDILTRGRKVAGILVEGRYRGLRLDTAVVGIGLNWVSPEGGRRSLGSRATGLAGEFDPSREERLSPEEMLGRVLAHVERAYFLLRSAGPAPFLAAWPGLSAHLGRPVIIEGVESSEVSKPGRRAAFRPRWALAGPLMADGSLEVVTPEGKRQRLISAEVRLRPPLLD